MLVSIPSAVKPWLVLFNNQVVMEAQWKTIEDNAFMENRRKLIMLCQAVKLLLQRLKLLKSLDLKLMLLKQLKDKMLIKLNLALKMSKLTLKLLLPLKLKLQLPLTLQLMKPTLWSAQLSDLNNILSKENLIEDTTLIMLTFLQTRTILWFKQLMTLILPGKPILVNFKSIMWIMGHIAKNTKHSPLLKHTQRLTKIPQLHLLDNKRISPLLGMRPKSIKNIHLPKIFQRVISQLTLTGEMLTELISLLSIEIKDIAVLATPFLSLKLSNNV